MQAIQPKISIIVPTYNCDKVLEDCLKSILCQTYKNKEIVIIDGSSTDNTLKIIEKYRECIAYYVSESDKGIYDAMNKGILAAAGEWLYFMGSDDTFFNATVLEDVLTDPTLTTHDVVYGNVIYKSKGEMYDGFFDSRKLYDKNICHQAIVIQKSVFLKLGLFDIKYKLWADYEFNIRWFNNPTIKHIYTDKILCLYNDTGFSSLSADKDFLLVKDQLFKLNHYKLIVTVIIPLLTKYDIPACLEQIRTQSYKDLDIIIIGDLSAIKNNSLKNYLMTQEGILLIESPHKNSMLDLWSEGVKAAKGQYIWLMNPGYNTDKNTVSSLMNFFTSGMMAELVYCLPANVNIKWIKTNVVRKPSSTLPESQQEITITNHDEREHIIVSTLRSRTDISNSAIFFKKNIFYKMGFNHVMLHQNHDWLLWFYLFVISDVLYIKGTWDKSGSKIIDSKEEILLQQLARMIVSSPSLSPRFRNKAILLLTDWWVRSLLTGNISYRASMHISKDLTFSSTYLKRLIIRFLGKSK